MTALIRSLRLVWLLVIGLAAAAGLDTASPVHAEFDAPIFSGRLGLVDLIHSDGTLNLGTGRSGALDFAGWELSLDAKRRPVFARARGETTQGDTGAAESGEAKIAVQEFSGLGNGLFDSVFALALSGNNLYVGGSFTHICGNTACDSGNIAANRIARWDGGAWSAVGNGLDSDVVALGVMGGQVYAGGSFNQACGNSACNSGNTVVNYVAKWNGSAWSAVGSGVDGDVQGLAVSGADLYIGGEFEVVCGNSACNSGNTVVNYVARWNGSAWSALGNGVDNQVVAVAVMGTDLYIGGSMMHTCGNSACNSGNTVVNHVAKWNGSAWSALGNGVDDTVIVLAVKGTDLYVGGDMIDICGNSTCDSGNTVVNHVAKWSGSAWSALGNGLDTRVYALAFGTKEVYAGGLFDEICGNAACNSGNSSVNFLARWNGTAWSAMGNGMNSSVRVLALRRGSLIAGGQFTKVCGDSACGENMVVNRIASHPCESKPVKPTQKAPAHNAIVPIPRPKLTWNAALCAENYTVIVRNAQTGQVAAKAVGLTKLKFKTGLLPSGTYSWFVKACNAKCAKSVKRTFTVP